MPVCLKVMLRDVGFLATGGGGGGYDDDTHSASPGFKFKLRLWSPDHLPENKKLVYFFKVAKWDNNVVYFKPPK